LGETQIIVAILQSIDQPDALGDLFAKAAEEETPRKS
jgi:hypothetical protein